MPVDVLGLVSSPNGDGHYNRFSKVFEALELNGLRTAVVTDTKIRNDRYFRGSDLHIINLPYSIGDDLDADSVTGDKGDTRDRGKIEITRRNQFLQILEKDKPRVVLLESYPFMRQGWENLADALVNYKDRNRDLIIGASVRDITGHAEMVRMGIIREDDPKLPKIDDLLERHIDALLIHGDPHVVPLDKKIKGALAEKTYYTGYVVDHMPPRTSMREEDRQVLFSVGAGGDGSQILLQALKSRDYCPNLKKRTWHLITGNRAENGFLAELANEAASRGFIVDCPDINIENRNPDIIISKDCPDFKQRLVDAFIAVIGGGYNTVIEALKGGARVVASALFKWNGENLTLHPEQASRLRHMKEAGFLRTLGTDELKDPKKLAGALEMIAGQEPGAIPEIKTHGAMVTAALIGQWYSDHLVSPLRDHPGAISRRDSLLTADT